MISLIRLIRLPNLLIIAFTQYAMRYLVLDPLVFSTSRSFDLQLGKFDFSLLVLATILIAAAGYIINDYFDTRTDWINKPKKVVVGVKIDRKTAMVLHTILNIAGVGIGVYLSAKINLLPLSFVFILAAGLLWFYSTTYKRQFLIGNLIVSLMTAMVPLIVVLFELPLLNVAYKDVMLAANANFNSLFYWVAAFSLFAFLLTLMREIIKDAEDFEGDSSYGMKTLPIIAGTRWTKGVLVSLVLVSVGLILALFLQHIFFSAGRENPDYLSLVYILAFLVLPFFVLLTLTLVADSKKDYKRISLVVKLIMLFGILYSGVVFYNLKFLY